MQALASPATDPSGSWCEGRTGGKISAGGLPEMEKLDGERMPEEEEKEEERERGLCVCLSLSLSSPSVCVLLPLSSDPR